jgi:CDP-diacylglycerol--glycerol-3-phosphate 3-phosphatidyltransferase
MIPTALTLLRLVLSVILIGWLLSDTASARIGALLLFLFAGFTDWLDGFLARRLKQTSALGALLDPIADKALVLGTLGALAWLSVLQGWMVLVIGVREVAVTAIRLWALKRQVVLAAATEGKLKTAVQMLTILLALCEHILGLGGWLGAAVQLCLWLALILTVTSGLMFASRHRTVIQDLLFGR